MLLVTILKKIFSSAISVLIFLGIIFMVVKYQLYNPENLGEYMNTISRFVDRITDRFSGNEKSEFGLDEYGITVETLPRGQSKYLIVLINNVNDNTELNKVISVVKVLDSPVIIGVKDIEADKLASLNSELTGYKVSYAIVIPNDKIGDYNEVKKYVTDELVKYGTVVNINTIIVDTVSEAVSRFAVLNNMAIIELDNTFGIGKLKVGGETTDNYYFKSLYYPEIQEEDAPLIKEKIKKMVKEKDGALIVGFDASYLTSESTSDDNEGEEYVSKSRLVQEAIINPVVELYYSSSYKFYDGNFDDYITFLENVVRVSGYLTESNAIIKSDEYGTKIEIPMGTYPSFVTIKIPKEIGLIKVQELASVNLYYMSNTKVESEKYHKQESDEGVIIYPLEDLENVKLVITYVTPAGE